LDCLDAQDAKLGIWFTRRLFDRIIPTLTEQVKIEAATTSEAKFEHEIMQFQAKQERLSNAPETPVRLTIEKPCSCVRLTILRRLQMTPPL